MASIALRNVCKTYSDGTMAVRNLDVQIADGEFVIFVGPSGCGKTSTLRMVAGLEEVTSGEVLIGDRIVTRDDAQDRDIAMVFQNYALYPHMSVFENIAFPLRCRGIAGNEIKARVAETASLLDLHDLQRKPRQLSGGQRQRVAMGRAIVREPQVFLMDEPLSNLDAKLRVQMRGEIRRIQREVGVTTIYVTHDQVEAMTMGDRIALMRHGELAQLGTPSELYDRPANTFVASFIGSPAMNLFKAVVERSGDSVTVRVGDQRLSPGPASRGRLGDHVGRAVVLGVRPEHLVSPDDSRGLPQLHGEVTLLEMLGHERHVHMSIKAEPVVTDEVLEVAKDVDASQVESVLSDSRGHQTSAIARLAADAPLSVGNAAAFGVLPDKMHFFDLEQGHAL